MKSILHSWNAGFVRRFHTNIRMVDYDDRDNAHQQRVAVLLLRFWPESTRAAIIAAITHDQGEYDFADFPYPVKRKFPQLRDLAHAVEEESRDSQGFAVAISEKEQDHINFCDSLDSYLWMLRCVPSLRNDKSWQAQLNDMFLKAREFGIHDEFFDLIEEANEFYT
jgi:hypothetical protein